MTDCKHDHPDELFSGFCDDCIAKQLAAIGQAIDVHSILKAQLEVVLGKSPNSHSCLLEFEDAILGYVEAVCVAIETCKVRLLRDGDYFERLDKHHNWAVDQLLGCSTYLRTLSS